MISPDMMHLPQGQKCLQNTYVAVSTLPDNNKNAWEMDHFMCFQQLNFVYHFLGAFGQ
jgi:hypothetical protein